MLWFEFLRLSPSYELARRYRASNGRLSDSDRARLPADFDRVLAVFDDLGDVQRYLFRPWWLERGLKYFGSEGAKQRTKRLFKTSSSVGLTDAKAGKIPEYFQNDWLEQNRPDVMVVAVPLTLTRQQAMKEFKKLYDLHIVPPPPPPEPKYKLATIDMHRQSIVDAMSVLFMRSANPKFKLWQVGVLAGISKTYSQKFDYKTTKRNAQNADEIRQLEMMTSRKFKLGKYLVENAARGIFPLAKEPEHWVDYDPAEFHRIISERNRWIKEEQTKYQ